MFLLYFRRKFVSYLNSKTSQTNFDKTVQFVFNPPSTNTTDLTRLIKERPVFFSKSKREGTKFTREDSGRPQKRPNVSAPTRPVTRGGFSGNSGGRFNKPRPNPTVSRGSNVQVKPTCQTCGRQHFGQCRAQTVGCYLCGEQGHFMRECPNKRENIQAAYEPTVQNVEEKELVHLLVEVEAEGVLVALMEASEDHKLRVQIRQHRQDFLL